MVTKKSLKSTAKKPTVQKASAPKKVASAKTIPKKAHVSNIKKPFSKSQMIEHLTHLTQLKKKDIAAILDGISSVMALHLNPKGPGEFNFSGLFKCKVVHKPATKAREGISPFTGKPTVFAAKPARNALKIRPLKKLKEVVSS